MLRRAAVLPVLLVAALAAACGSSPATQTTNGNSLSITYGQVSNSLAFLPVYVAEHEGYFAAEHVTVNPEPFTILGTGAKVAAALAGGSIDIGGGVMTDAFNLSKAGQDPDVISGLVDQYYVDIVVGKNAHVAPENAPLLTKIKSLKGLRIGITGPGSGTSALLTYLFKLAGMNAATDATEVNLGGESTAAVDALKSGTVDAVSYAQPLGQEASITGIGSIYISPSRGDIPALDGAVQGVLYTDQAVLSSKKAAVEAFVTAIAKAEHLLHTASDSELTTLIGDYLPSLTPAVVAAVIPLVRSEVPGTPTVPTAGYQSVAAFHKASGLFLNPPSYGTLIDTSLISAAVAKAGS
jgi:ABC-type nitrate/sulfonate/bicarbonate transport system substrate-binding protein